MRFLVVICCLALPAAADAQAPDTRQLKANKQIARDFYRDLWFTDNTDRYSRYVADRYVVHDVGDRTGVTEPAVEQKRIADFFWKNGTMSGTIDYQVAEGDLVATRWILTFEPDTFLGHALLGGWTIPIINVFRFENGRIIEFWNHRHDIATGKTRGFFLQGLGTGLLVALLPAIYAWRLRRRLKQEAS